MQWSPKKTYDFSLEVSAPKQALAHFCSIINEMASKVFQGHDMPPISEDDEARILCVLFGIGRMIEVNNRISFETFVRNEELQDKPNPKDYKHVLRGLKKYVDAPEVHPIFCSARTITDGIVHGNFNQAYKAAKKAYSEYSEHLLQDGFHEQTFFESTITKHGLNLNVEDGTATDSQGNSIETIFWIPTKSKTIADNLKSFFISGAFLRVFDILYLAYKRSFHMRRCIELAK